MTNHNQICHNIFRNLVSSLVLVLVSFTTTTAISWYKDMPIFFDQNPVYNKCIDEERHALLHFKSYIHHDPYGLLSTWILEEEKNATNYCCSWSGVTCYDQTGHITSINLHGYLEGEISSSLLNLSYLNQLDLSYNSFTGTIPMFIGCMTQLLYLDLSNNYFTGSIPMFIGSNKLAYLYLDTNDFTGSISSELGNLTNLEALSLESLSGCIIETLDWLSRMSQLDNLFMSGISLGKADNWVNVISSLQKLSTLFLNRCNLSEVMHPYSYPSSHSSSSSIVTLSLVENNLSSSIYHWLFVITGNNLVELDLSGNKLDGIPKYFRNLCNLTTFDFVDNSIDVKFPDFLNNLSGCTSVALQELNAESSQLTGLLSDHIQKFSSLQYLYLSNNKLNGIGEKVWQLPELQTLDISSNSLKGTISEYIGTTQIMTVDLSNNPLEGVSLEAHMSNLSSIEYIDLSSCKQGPHFPKWIQRLKFLTSIDISNNGILDTIPEEFWNMWPSQLRYLNLSSNKISGKITDLLSNFSPDSPIIDLSANNLSGPIMNVPSSLPTLDLSRNKFSGEISFLCQVDGSFSFLDLSHNLFTGQIPDCLWHFKKLKVLSLGHNNLSGRLPSSIEYLISLEVLYLYNNNFTEEFPSSLKKCSKLTFLDLGANKFSGYMPVWIGEKLPELYALNLASNNFFGTIPSQLCQLVHLQILDLSVNNLYGSIPSCLNNLTSMAKNGFPVDQIVHHLNYNISHQSEYVDHAMIQWQGSEREFRDNVKEVPPIIGGIEDDGEDINGFQKWFYIGGATGFSIGFWMTCIALLVNNHGRSAFYHLIDILENWVYVKVMVLIRKSQRVANS
ncbi:hypothetical protein QVD17_01022 [Tagetes erecta]|uniref:Leucine-rich repeat-containing N-terminal plant-type domain-containing protein n=1 Tax=Tagetes erecta TaxID=13708 RepID=A0AAD8L9T9_TARER|nr:hypothetical protein QVD17_01022 [Tagetes erecta]